MRGLSESRNALPSSAETAARLHSLQCVYRDGLLHDTLPFWLSVGLDQRYGGNTTCVDRDGTVVDSDKGVWQQGRFAWLLAKLYNQVERREDWLHAAQLGIDFIDRHCFDHQDGRMWFQVTRDGRPVRKRRYAFSESFASIAMAQYAQATQSSQWRDRAVQVFQQFVDHSTQSPPGGAKYEPARRLKSISVPMITLVTAQELREAVQFEQADHWIDWSVASIREFVQADLEVVLEQVGPGGEIVEHFDGRTLNPGHAIEAAWFIMREGDYRGQQEWIQLGTQMLRWMWRRGWDAQHGGLLYFVDLHGGSVAEYWHDMKFWWPHNEAIIATLMAYVLTGDEQFAEYHRQVHEWAYRHFPDTRDGEWFGYLHRDGSRSSTLKGNLWKGPFHLPRMQLVCWQLLKRWAAEQSSPERS